MSNSKDAVRKILDAVKADKRTSLTAPEGKVVCDAYGITFLLYITPPKSLHPQQPHLFNT